MHLLSKQGGLTKSAHNWSRSEASLPSEIRSYAACFTLLVLWYILWIEASPLANSAADIVSVLSSCWSFVLLLRYSLLTKASPSFAICWSLWTDSFKSNLSTKRNETKRNPSSADVDADGRGKIKPTAMPPELLRWPSELPPAWPALCS